MANIKEQAAAVNMLPNARLTAAQVINSVFKDGAYANIAHPFCGEGRDGIPTVYLPVSARFQSEPEIREFIGEGILAPQGAPPKKEKKDAKEEVHYPLYNGMSVGLDLWGRCV